MTRAPQRRTGILRMLELLGLPTENVTGHELGCGCEDCRAARDRYQEAVIERRRRGAAPQTWGELLALARQKRRMH